MSVCGAVLFPFPVVRRATPRHEIGEPKFKTGFRQMDPVQVGEDQ